MDKQTYMLLIRMLSMHGEELENNLSNLSPVAKDIYTEMKQKTDESEAEGRPIIWDIPFDYE
ncbi:MAG: hypothetical protein Q4A10_06780 [Aerococcaceae bacterium]|nr:hypothetical protein [Aerococcaceae bacterium]